VSVIKKYFRDPVSPELYHHSDNEPVTIRIGTGQMLKGVEMALMGLCEGVHFNVTIPPLLGFGAKGDDSAELGVPGGATLKFEIEVEKVSPLPNENYFSLMDLDLDNRVSYEECQAYFINAKEDFQGTPNEDIFFGDDKDNDGYVSFDEFSVSCGLFFSNAKPSECVYVYLQGPKGLGGKQDHFFKGDSDGSGSLTYKEAALFIEPL
jgi:hypothetical protein